MNRSQIDALIVSKFISGPTMSHILAREGMGGVLNYIDRLMGEGKLIFAKDHGAMEDDTRLLDVTVTGGSKTITSASAQWTANDVGKHIKLNWCDAGNDLVTTIADYNNANSVDLADFPNMPSAFGSPLAVLNDVTTYYCTDDTAAVQSALVAAHAQGSAEILFTGNCGLAGEVVGMSGGINFRGVLNFVPVDFFGQAPPPGQIKLRGITPTLILSNDPVHESYPNMSGAGLHAYRSSTTPGDSIIASAYNPAHTMNNGFSQGYVSFENMKFLVPANGGYGWIEPGMGAGLSGPSGSLSGSAKYKGCVSTIDDAILRSSEPTVRHFGFSTTNENSQHSSAIEDCLTHGFYDAAELGEHCWVNQFGAFANIHPLNLKAGRFPVTAGVILQNWCRHGITGTANNKGINIQLLNIESRNDTQNGTPAWWQTIEDGGLLYDPSGFIQGGTVKYFNGSGLVPTKNPLAHPMTFIPH